MHIDPINVGNKKKKDLTARVFAITLLVIMLGSMIAGLIFM